MMDRIVVSRTFEQGPIRPPSEAASLLVRFTRNCPWNKCSFCPVYKHAHFSRRSLREIRDDIEVIAAMVEDIKTLSWSLGEAGRITSSVMEQIWRESHVSDTYRHVASWLFFGTGQVFLQDANSLIMSTDELAEAIQVLRTTIPGVRRVTSYGRSSTIARKSLDELVRLREAGLDRIHIGMESGSNTVLAFVHKGATAQQHIEAGVKVREAGITLSEYVMPGLGGAKWSAEHARETARVLNEINPHFIRLRTLQVPPVGKLSEDVKAGRFSPLSDDEIVREIRQMIEGLDNVESVLTSDHVRNLLEEVEGRLPEDREKMLATIDEYLALPEGDRILYRIGRRGGALRSVRELDQPLMRQRLRRAQHHLEQEYGGDVERILYALSLNHI